ncbi:MAG: rane dipeptidase [Thermomicrobiales bacterium]|nr:rane dipeptidase [Thermomicrobiales bacterium]
MSSPDQTFVVDAHSDFVSRIMTERRAGRTGALATEYLPALREGGVRLAAMQVGSDAADQSEHEAMAAALEKISYVKAEVAACDDVQLVRTRQELEECLAGNRVGILLSFEGGQALVDNVAYVSIYHELGVRMAALTWNDCNRIACGSGQNDSDAGLTDFGVEVVREMGRLGIILDVSHLSDAGVAHALSVASGPVVATHSNARAVCDHARNLTDQQIRAIADRGGVIGLNFFPRFLDKIRRPGPADLIAQLNHLIDVGGEDVVGLGPDFIDYSREDVEAMLLSSSVDYGSDFSYPVGFESTKDLGRMPEILVEAGYGSERIEKILGGNWLRVFRAALA